MAFDKTGAYEKGTFKHYVLLNDVTADANSIAIPVAGARKITFFFKRSNHSSGASTFKAQVSIDGGTTWVDFNQLISHVANTNAQNLTRVATVALNSDSSAIASMDLSSFNFNAMRVNVAETTDGTHRAEALVEF